MIKLTIDYQNNSVTLNVGVESKLTDDPNPRATVSIQADGTPVVRWGIGDTVTRQKKKEDCKRAYFQFPTDAVNFFKRNNVQEGIYFLDQALRAYGNKPSKPVPRRTHGEKDDLAEAVALVNQSLANVDLSLHIDEESRLVRVSKTRIIEEEV